MKKLFTFLVFALLSLNNFSQTKNFIDQPYIETEVEVDSLVIPDRIYLTITLNESDSKNKKSTEELESQMLTVLKSIGVDTKKDLSLLDLSSDFKKYFLSDKKVLKIKVYTLLVRDAKTANKVLIGLEKVKISNVVIEKLEYSKAEKLILSLKSKAILKALKNVQAIVNPLNQKVGKAIMISDLGNLTNALQGKAAGIRLRGMSSIYGNRSTQSNFAQDFRKMKFTTRLNVKFTLE